RLHPLAIRLRPLVSGFAAFGAARSNKPSTGLNALIRPIKRLLCVVIVRNRNHPAKRKDEICAGTCLHPAGSEAGTGRYGSIASCLNPVHLSPAARSAEGKAIIFKITSQWAQ